MAERLLSINQLTLPQADLFSLPAMPGLSFDRDSKFRKLPESGPVYVEMNSARHTRVPRDRIGQIFTTALAGCTGVAAIAKTEDDTMVGISHFDALVDSDQRQRTEGSSASDSFMKFFMKIGKHVGAEEFEFHVAYAMMHETDDNYGDRSRNFSDWHFLDQLQTFAERNDTDVKFHPYEGMSVGHTLLASVALNASASVEFK